MELILNFHGVGEPPPGTPGNELGYWWDEAPFLEVLDAVVAARDSLGVPVAITFDDGNASDATIAMPALARRGLDASFFVCAGRMGAPGYLDAAAIRDLLAAHMTVGSHGMHHADWTKLDGRGLEREISEARRRLQDVCGRDITQAAIPFGHYDRLVLQRLRTEGFRRVYTSDGGLASPQAWLQPRNTLEGWQTGIEIGELMRTVMSPLKRARRLVKRVHRTIL